MIGDLIISLALAIRAVVLYLAIVFFFIISVYALFYDQYAISQSCALIVIALLLVTVKDAIKEKKQ